MRANLASIVLLASVLPSHALLAQDQITFRFFHGKGGQSRTTVDDADRRLENQHLRFSRVLTPGTEVCIGVQNAHPINYRYSLDAIVDTSESGLPDLAKFTAFLSALPQTLGKTAAMAPRMIPRSVTDLAMALDSVRKHPGYLSYREFRSFPEIRDAEANYYLALGALSADIARADSAAVASDLPEPADGSAPGKVGFGYAQTAIAGLSVARFQFNDPKLKENLAELYKKAKESAQGSYDHFVADAFGGYGDLLLAKRDKLRTGFAPDVNGSPRLCKPVANGKNTFRLF